MPLPTERVMAWLVRNRSRLPRFIRALPDAVERNPDGLISRLAYHLYGRDARAPEPTAAPPGDPRLLVGPANYAGQGREWARALEREYAGLGARCMAVAVPGAHAFPADTTVPFPVYRHSRAWQEREREAVISGFDHVLVESMRPLFGSLYPSISDEIAALRDAGISIALMAHGTDFRSPARHIAAHRWSPFADDPRSSRLQQIADRNAAVAQASGVPVFVSTPDLLDDLPDAIWCPVVVDLDRWSAGTAPFTGTGAPLVVHIPTSPHAKGTHLVEPALQRLHDRGVIEYRRLEGIPSSAVPEALGAADIVLDQFRVGSYGVAACEAMALGRTVVGHVAPRVREHVATTTGLELPIIEADPESLERVLEQIIEDREGSAARAKSGRPFVQAVHSGSMSARALWRGWLRPGDAS